MEICECCICGGKFHKKRANQRTCLKEECKKQLNRLNASERYRETSSTHCKHCGDKITFFTGHNQTFCSYKCRGEYEKINGRNIERLVICKYCGKEIIVDNMTTKYCCDEHRRLSYNAKRRRRGY